MTNPRLVCTTLEKISQQDLTNDTALILFGYEPKEVDAYVESLDTVPFIFSTKFLDVFPIEELAANYCTLLDMETMAEFINCVRPFKTLYLAAEPEHSSVAFLLYTTALIIYGRSVDDSLYEAALVYKEAEPKALWVAMCIDKVLSLNLKLIDAYNDYYASGTLVNSRGKLIERSFP